MSILERSRPLVRERAGGALGKVRGGYSVWAEREIKRPPKGRKAGIIVAIVAAPCITGRRFHTSVSPKFFREAPAC